MTCNSGDTLEQPLHFCDEAMATIFELFVCHCDSHYAAGAAKAAFTELHQIENELSRYFPNSDIARINRLRGGQRISIGLDTMRCLLAAKLFYEQTGGLFNPCLGTIAECFKNDSNTEQPGGGIGGMDTLLLDENELTVEVLSDSADLDLGAVGKGYALDQMAKMLRQWGITKALLNAGTSTVSALDAPDGQAGWEVVIHHPRQAEHVVERLRLVNQSLSCSSIVQRSHIIDPSTKQPISGRLACWVVGPNGTACDALSTAFMMADENTIRSFCADNRVFRVILCSKEDEITVISN